MDPIILPGFTPLVDNRIYAMNGMQLSGYRGGDGATQTVGIISLNKYRRPSCGEVWKHVCDTAGQVDGDADSGLPPQFRFADKTPLQIRLMKLDGNVRKSLVERRRGYEDLVRESSKAVPEGKPEEKYLNVRSGAVPQKVLEMHRRIGSEDPAAVYIKAFSDPTFKKYGLGDSWSADILLGEGWELPPSNEMDVLLKHGTFGSRTLHVKPDCDPGVVDDTIRALYAGLSESGKIGLISDCSDAILEMLSEGFIKGLQRRIDRERGKAPTVLVVY